MEKVGQNGDSSSSGSGSSASLSKDSEQSVGNASNRYKSYNTRFNQHLTNENSVECKSELDMYSLESML